MILALWATVILMNFFIGTLKILIRLYDACDIAVNRIMKFALFLDKNPGASIQHAENQTPVGIQCVHKEL